MPNGEWCIELIDLKNLLVLRYDGDEMVLHNIQSTSGKAEAMVLMAPKEKIITHQRNAPINGPIQDPLVAVYTLTNTWLESVKTETMVSKSLVMNIFTALDFPYNRIRNFMRRGVKFYPSYFKHKDGNLTFSNSIPGRLFVSILFPPDFCFRYKNNINSKFPIVKIKDGIMLPDSGPLERKSLRGGNSVIHNICIEYNTEICQDFISDFELLMNHWFHHEGFSISIADCINDNPEKVTETLLETKAKVDQLLLQPNTIKREIDILNTLNASMGVGLSIAKNSMNKGERNALNMMRESGGKGSVVNLSQITVFVGQQSFSGGRIPAMISNRSRTNYSSDWDDYGMEARGFVSNNYLTGLNPDEAFFHAQAGRQGVISTACKTADTGYIQKKIGKKLEDLRVWTDLSVRDSSGNITTFFYGDDGFDPCKLYPVEGISFPFFCNPKNLIRKLNSQVRNKKESSTEDEEKIILDDEEVINLITSYVSAGTGHTLTELIERQTEIQRSTLAKLLKGQVIYVSKIPDLCEEIRNLCEKAKIGYGTMVGFIATNDIGETNTQMTLNVFHLAGYGGRNSSGGIGRLTDILHVIKTESQKQKTTVIYPTNPELKQIKEDIKILKQNEENSAEIKNLRMRAFEILNQEINKLVHTSVSDILEKSEMKYLGIDPNSSSSPVNFYTFEEYKEEWWTNFYLKNSPDDKIEAEHWVILLHFSVEKLVELGISLEEIALIIEDEMDGHIMCIPSPDIIGRIEVYTDFNSIQANYGDILDPLLADPTGRSLITNSNANFFVCRDMVLKEILKIKIQGVNGIISGYPREDADTGDWVIDTNGSNFAELLAMENVEIENTISDNFNEIYQVLGIEAARIFLINEINRVISADGTYVNPRHIQTLVDKMTHTGVITSVHRCGMGSEAGPIPQILFEKPIDHAVSASAFTNRDEMRGVSAAVMYGLTAKVGSGVVNIKSSENISIKPAAIPKDLY